MRIFYMKSQNELIQVKQKETHGICLWEVYMGNHTKIKMKA